MQSLRTLSGFSATIGDYYIQRDLIQPDDKLLNKVFPIKKIENQLENASVPESAANFLSFLKLIAKVFLQDSAVLMKTDNFKQLNLFSHPLFKSDDFKSFASDLNTSIIRSLPPGELMLKQCLPCIHSTFDRNLQVNVDLHSKTLTKLEQLENKQNQLFVKVNNISNGSVAAPVLQVKK
jgi:hypothetical protein